MSTEAPIVLIVGASGQLGIHLIRSAAKMETKPTVHAFVRDPTRLSESDHASCASVQVGDGRNSADIVKALQTTKASTVIIAIGEASIMKPTSTREQNATAVMEAVSANAELASLRIVVVSSLGAGGTKIEMGFGRGAALTWMLRHVLKDHDQQEDVFLKGMPEEGGRRDHLLIVRATGLGVGKPTGETHLFQTKGKTSKIDRADLADWIMGQVCDGSEFGKCVNISGGPA